VGPQGLDCGRGEGAELRENHCLRGSHDDLIKFSEALFEPDDLVELRPISKGRGLAGRRWVRASELWADRRLFDQLWTDNRAGSNIYLGMNPRWGEGGRAEDVKLARSLWVDFDDGFTPDQARMALQQAQLPNPTVLVNSGHGMHCYWRLDEALSDLGQWTALQRALIGLVGSDPTIHDPPRIMRLPGFLNIKREPWVPAQLIEAWPDRRYRVDEVVHGANPRSNALAPVDTHGAVIVHDNILSLISSPTPSPSTDLSLPENPVSISDPRIVDAIEATVPRAVGHRNRSLFEFVRRLKSLPELAALQSPAIQPYIRAWFQRVLSIIATKDWEVTWEEAMNAWEKARIPHGTDLLREAARRAQEASDPRCAAGLESPKARLLLRVCRELQRLRGREDFFLGCRDAGNAIGTDRTTACTLLNLLCRRGLLTRTWRGHTGKANEYRYLGDLA